MNYQPPATSPRPLAATHPALLILLALGVGVVGGLAVTVGNPLVPFVALAGLVALPWLVTRPLADLVLVVLTVTLLPFATSPVRLAVLTPTLLEGALLLLYAAWLLRALLGSGATPSTTQSSVLSPQSSFQRTPADGWLILFLGCTLFAFVLGLARDASTDVVHNYFKLVLSVGIFFVAGSVLRDNRSLAVAMRTLMLSGAASALIGIAMWRLPDDLATSLLSRLSVVGYPTDRVVRYVEDNPALGERAVGTQVDPNSFAGLLVIIIAITVAAFLARKPLMPRWLLGGILLADITALVLTQSRTALLGVLAAAVFIGTVRYRRLWAWGVAGAVVIALLGVGSGYFGRVVSGLRFEDQANQMRLSEYANALDIIGRYPAFGVGFGTAGELDLTTGVSSVYLTIAERAGLLGLAAFVVTLLVILFNAIPAITRSRRRAPPAEDDSAEGWSLADATLLGSTAALVGAMVVGVADHYYFNIEFPHAVALFWLVAALAVRRTEGVSAEC